MRLNSVLLLLLISAFLQAQNVVSNPSFEYIISCPNGSSSPFVAIDWVASRNSPDLLHRCSIDGFEIPCNHLGCQHTCIISDSAYALVITYTPANENYREHIRGTLSSPLIPGVMYYVAFKTALCDSCVFASNRLGAQFTTTPYLDTVGLLPNPSPINNFAHIQSNDVIIEKNDWTTVRGWFVADSAYNHIIIGNFYDAPSTDKTELTGYFNIAAYYIENICVSLDSMECEHECNMNNSMNNPPMQVADLRIYPNPSQSVVNIQMLSEGVKLAKVFDIYGRVLAEMDFINQAVIDVVDFPDGLYILKITSQTGDEINEKLIKK